MASARIRVGLVLLVAAAAAGPVAARVIRVSPGGSIQAAVDDTRPGDTVLIECGMYVENVRVIRSGAPDAPITIEGAKGAEIYGYAPWRPVWSPAGFAEGVFRAACDAEPDMLCYNGLYVLKCTKNQQLILQRGSRTKESPTPGGFKHIRGVWAYMDGFVYLRTPDAEDPSEADVFIARRMSACIFLDGASNIVVRGLTFRYATHGLLARNGWNLTVEHCTVGPTEHGIRLWQNVHDSKVAYCEVTCPAIFDWITPPAAGSDGTNAGEDIYYVNKTAGPQNRRSISLLNSGRNNEIAYNHVHNCYQGIEAKEDTEEGGSSSNRNLQVHHNTIRQTAFYGLSPNGTDINGKWHHNLLIDNGSAGIRIKPPSAEGPLYIYRNVILHDRGRPWWASDPQEGPVLIYHNTFVGGWTMLRMASGKMPGTHLLANAFIGQTRAYRHGRFMGTIRPEQIDYNLVTDGEMEFYDKLVAAGYQAHGVTAKLPADADRDRILAAGKDKGPDWTELTARLRARYPELPRVLPGTEHAGGRADIGAYEAGLIDGEHRVGVDTSLCGAEAYHARKEQGQAHE